MPVRVSPLAASSRGTIREAAAPHPPQDDARAGSPAMGEKPSRGGKEEDAWHGMPLHATMKRVKVYRLEDNGKWDDQGTGHVTIDYIEGSRELVLAVVDEEDNDTLLLHTITPDDIYRKQDERIISWRDPEKALELALSFQEAEGCSFIWENMCNIRQDLQSNILSCKSSSSVNGELKELPPLDMSSLSVILKAMQCGTTEQKQLLTQLISKDRDFFPKLVKLFRTCNDLKDRDGLHLMFRLVKAIILLNSSAIFDRIFSDDLILDIIGILEYNPEDRAFFKDHAVLKEAIPIRNASVVSKIRQTYRLGYIKDVILPKILDDDTRKSLDTIIHGNNVSVVSFLKDNADFVQDLFERMRSSNVSSTRQLVFFLREFCSVSKSFELAQQITLSRDLANQGVFDIVSDVLQCRDKVLVSAGTDILLHFLTQDPDLLRSYIAKHEETPGQDISLLGLLLKRMVTDYGGEMICQFLEIVQMLLNDSLVAVNNVNEYSSVVEIFYKKYFDKLIDIIESSCPPKSIAGSTFGSVGVVTSVEILNICDFLCFSLVEHLDMTKIQFLKSKSIEKILTLTRRRDKVLVVAAVRFMSTVITTNDELLTSHVIKLNLLKPIIEAFVENGDRYNLLQYTSLALFEYIIKENRKSLIVYVVESFWNQLVKFKQLKSIQAFRLKYEEIVNSAETEDTTSVGHMRKKADERGPDKEDCFNTDSNEEDSATQTTQVQQRCIHTLYVQHGFVPRVIRFIDKQRNLLTPGTTTHNRQHDFVSRDLLCIHKEKKHFESKGCPELQAEVDTKENLEVDIQTPKKSTKDLPNEVIHSIGLILMAREDLKGLVRMKSCCKDWQNNMTNIFPLDQPMWLRLTDNKMLFYRAKALTVFAVKLRFTLPEVRYCSSVKHLITFITTENEIVILNLLTQTTTTLPNLAIEFEDVRQVVSWKDGVGFGTLAVSSLEKDRDIGLSLYHQKTGWVYRRYQSQYSFYPSQLATPVVDDDCAYIIGRHCRIGVFNMELQTWSLFPAGASWTMYSAENCHVMLVKGNILAIITDEAHVCPPIVLRLNRDRQCWDRTWCVEGFSLFSGSPSSLSVEDSPLRTSVTLPSLRSSCSIIEADLKCSNGQLFFSVDSCIPILHSLQLSCWPLAQLAPASRFPSKQRISQSNREMLGVGTWIDLTELQGVEETNNNFIGPVERPA